MALMDVLLDEMRDLYSAENQILKALPKLVKGANDPSLKSSLANHLEETKGQVQRLRSAFESLGKKPTGQHCDGMEGLCEEGENALEKDEEGANYDLGIIGGSLRVEHYEIAGYTVAIGLAQGLGLNDVVGLLNENLSEELNAAKVLEAASKPLVKQAASEANATENEEDEKPKTAKEKTSERKSKEDEKEATKASSKKK